MQDQIFDLCYLGKGGFTYADLYNMPVITRIYYYQRLKYLQEMQESANNRALESNKMGGGFAH